MQTITIVSEKGGKTRSFCGSVAAYIKTDMLWDGGQANTDYIRPTWALILASEGAFGPLMANLRTGRKADLGEKDWSRKTPPRMEFMKSEKYALLTQRTPFGIAGTLYLPAIYNLDPGMIDPVGIQFALVLQRQHVQDLQWDRRQALDHCAKVGVPVTESTERLLDLAPYVAGYIDRRTRCPLPVDTRFYAQLMYAALNIDMMESSLYSARRTGLHAEGLDDAGMLPAVAWRCTHEDFEKFLAQQAKLFFQHVRF